MLVHLKVRPAQRPRSACLRGRPCRMSRASGLALAAVLVVLCAGRLAAAQLDPGREADPPCKKAAASQDPDGEELVGLFSTKTKELLDDKGAAHAKPAVVVIFMNLDGGKKQTQYVLKRARKVAAERRGSTPYVIVPGEARRPGARRTKRVCWGNSGVDGTRFPNGRRR